MMQIVNYPQGEGGQSGRRSEHASTESIRCNPFHPLRFPPLLNRCVMPSHTQPGMGGTVYGD